MGLPLPSEAKKQHGEGKEALGSKKERGELVELVEEDEEEEKEGS